MQSEATKNAANSTAPMYRPNSFFDTLPLRTIQKANETIDNRLNTNKYNAQSLAVRVRLAQLMIEHNLGVSSVTAYEIKRIDSDYFVGD